MLKEFKVSYKLKYSERAEPLDGSINTSEPTADKAIESITRLIRKNPFEHYPQILEINATEIKDMKSSG